MATKNTIMKTIKNTSISSAVGYLTNKTVNTESKNKNKNLNNKEPSSLEIAEEKLKLLYSELSEIIVAAIGEDKGLEGRRLKKFKEALSTAKRSKKKLSFVVEGVRERASKDNDLDQAIKEAERAIKHAKTFLLKK
jgi:hypothetical protein